METKFWWRNFKTGWDRKSSVILFWNRFKKKVCFNCPMFNLDLEVIMEAWRNSLLVLRFCCSDGYVVLAAFLTVKINKPSRCVMDFHYAGVPVVSWICPRQDHLLAKGQLISKCLLGVIVLTKIATRIL